MGEKGRFVGRMRRIEGENVRVDGVGERSGAREAMAPRSRLLFARV